MKTFEARLRAALLAGRGAHVRGLGNPAPRRSDGYEFAELRGYVEGDDPRRIDWAATARAGALQTRVVFEDTALVLAAIVDASASMHVGRTRSNYDAACAAMRLWYAAAIDDDRCARIGAQPLVARGLRGRAAAALCSDVRDPLGTPLGGALELGLATLPRGARLLIASDFFELDTLAARLRACAARFDVTALLARDPWHAGLPLGGFVRLRDAESGRVVRAFVDRRARARYVAAVELREGALLRELRELGTRAALLDANAGPEAALGAAFALA